MTVQDSIAIDWDRKESVRAEIRSRVRRQLARHGYPVEAEGKAIELVLEQARVLAW